MNPKLIENLNLMTYKKEDRIKPIKDRDKEDNLNVLCPSHLKATDRLYFSELMCNMSCPPKTIHMG
jgi:hypothetical protein